ncbi:hypothetical protein A4H97_08680 [Niastella yeongjuensis]|uniref:Gliding motility-associated C-terminal domain-containing protein n=1 Tax=Niastella yeongjuensis TaxID=354355 RepID=A0A1V9EEQ7_9BACT|nr:gliding motility-associated C-terminal domain-containing protein [Niastella yeongjuensis]OQP44444.1 hypothetical protein A4H97_08680 [Niastella yeongjuensis]SEO87496.1 gliding motility-associated C-terminal domain-containing protein [Niastella yeongjuensis]
MYRFALTLVLSFLLYNNLVAQVVFVAGTTAALTGVNAGKVMQVDFNYGGEVYVQGGDNTAGQIAKLSNGGGLLWKYSVPVPGWQYGGNFGGWAVEKTTGHVYVGPGAAAGGGRVIRLNGVSGTYDNYRTRFFTDANNNNGEIWKMRWYCNGGSPQILIASGGGTNGDYHDNMGMLLPPATGFSSYNVTGITTYPYKQDVADFVVDPANKDLYCILASDGTPFVNNRIYKNSQPYTAADQKWNTLTGYTTLQEDNNAPFMAGSGSGTNAANVLAVSSKYLFYYDGKNLKAFDKSTGATVGTPLTFSSTALMQQGIYADNCDHVFIGTASGSIKVLQFNGTVFDDNAVADIDIPGYSGKAVYALEYDEDRNYVYAGGDGFVAAVNLSAYCALPKPRINYILTAKATKNSVTATIFPAPPANAVITYTLLKPDGGTATSSTASFTNLHGINSFTIFADIVIDCQNTTILDIFQLSDLDLDAKTETVCGGKGGRITIIGKGGTPPYTYGVDNLIFGANNVFSNLTPGTHVALIKDVVNYVEVSIPVIITVSDLVVDAGNDATICEGLSTPLSGTSNGINFSWTPVAGISNTTIVNPSASPPTTTKYYLSATKGTCTLTDSLVVTVLPAPIAHAGNDTSVCYTYDGLLHGSGGLSYKWKPETYLSNTAVDAPEVIHPERSVLYTLQVTDAQGCRSLKEDSVLFHVVPPTQVWAGNDTIVALGQPLQMQAVDLNKSGFTQFAWSPSYGLTTPSTANPIAQPENNITYQVTAVTPEGCTASDAVFVKVFKNVDIYVPNAFTPNGDGRNDIFRVTAPGMKALKYFVIMNRWGQEVFRTTDLAAGWNGTLKGNHLSAGTFVWALEGVDYTGRVIRKKGTIELIR